MSFLLSFEAPLQSIFCPKESTFLKKGLLILTGVLLLAVSAHISIPLQPVPLTFQSSTVILIGMGFGARLSTYTLLAYLIAGICGLPVFADTTETTLLFGPTSGYLLGFLPAAAFSGYLAQNGWAKHILSSFIASCLGACIIFFFGVSVLAIFVGVKSAFVYGLMPFIFTEPCKLFAASLLIPRLWKQCADEI